ncbi:ribulose-phosphate 3-epimerase [Candidatus Woesearchaeota archaeon]|nr:ribulose-phosphate 3-epimerase [Candidatus Woesearchaeota archaeon]
MVKIAPSILSADFGRLADEIRKVEKYVDMMHIDVMDGHFVPNITFGPPVVRSIRVVTKLPFDVHLMVEQPDNYIDQFIDAGANILTVHAETAVHLNRTISSIRKKGAKAAVALNPSTPLTALDHVLQDVGMVLIMTVNPGFGGQSFIKSMLPKIKKLRETIDREKLEVEIEVDGGINSDTARQAVAAGADIVVAGSYIYESADMAAAISSLRGTTRESTPSAKKKN